MQVTWWMPSSFTRTRLATSGLLAAQGLTAGGRYCDVHATPSRLYAWAFALAVVAVLGSGALVPAARSAAGPLTATPITWGVLGLDSNNVNTGPNVFPVGVRVCNTGSDAVSGVAGSWLWIAGSGAASTFDTPVDGATITAGTIAGNACRAVYFDVTVHRSPSPWNSSRSYRITVTGTGVATATVERRL